MIKWKSWESKSTMLGMLVKQFQPRQNYTMNFKKEQRILKHQFHSYGSKANQLFKYNSKHIVSQVNEAFKQTSQSLLDAIQQYISAQNQIQDQLRKIYGLNAKFLKICDLQIKEQLMENNKFVGLIRTSLSNLDKLRYVKEKTEKYQVSLISNTSHITVIFVSETPQLEDAEELLQKNEIIIKQISILQKKLKAMYIDHHGQKYFSEMKHKLYKQSMDKIQEVKQVAKKQLKVQQEQFQQIFVLLKFQDELNSFQSLVEQIIPQLQQKINKKQISSLQGIHKQVLQMKQQMDEMTFESSIKNYLLAIIEQLLASIQPSLNLGDVDSLIEFQQVRFDLENQLQSLEQFFEDFFTNISQILYNSTEVDQISTMQIDLKRTLIPIKKINLNQSKRVNQQVKAIIQMLKMRREQVLQLSDHIDILLESIVYLSVQNLESISTDFSEHDTETPVNQMEELLKENANKLSLIENKQMIWLQQEAIIYKELIQTETQGFQWLQNLFANYKLFQQQYRQLILKQEKSLEQQNSLNESQRSITVTIPFSEFSAFLEQVPFGNYFLQLNLVKPATNKWSQYIQILEKELEKAYSKTYLQLITRIDTLNGGVSMQAGLLDQRKAEKVYNWMRRAKIDYCLQQAILIFQGQQADYEELFEFCILASQVYLKVAKKGGRKTQEEDKNINDIYSIIMSFVNNLIQQLEQQILENFSIVLGVIDNPKFFLYSPVTLLSMQSLLNQIDSIDQSVKCYLQFECYLHLQFQWIQITTNMINQKETHDSNHPQTLQLVQLMQNISQSRFLDMDQIMQILHFQERSNYEILVREKVQKAREQILTRMNPQNTDQFQDQILKMNSLLSSISKYENFNQRVEDFIRNIKIAIEYKELMQYSNEQQLPECTWQYIYSSIDELFQSVDKIVTGLEEDFTADFVEIGILKIDLRNTRATLLTLQSWGFTFKEIFNDLVQKYQRQLAYIYRDYQEMDEKEDLQIQLEQVWIQFDK